MMFDHIPSLWINEMNTNVDASIRAWDSVADNYVYEEKNSLANDPFLQFLQSKISLTSDMTVLDVGCGAGAYSAAISKRVGQVTGTDFSPAMLRIGRDYAAQNNLTNIEFIEANWWECDPAVFSDSYDLVFAHTTPAIADYSSLIKMIKLSRRYCALCKPARRRDLVADEVRRIAGLERSSNDDSIAYAFDTIWGMGYNPELAYHDTVWENNKPLQEAEQWYLNRLKGTAVLSKEKEQAVLDYLNRISVNGMVHETIHTTLVSIFWEVS